MHTLSTRLSPALALLGLSLLSACDRCGVPDGTLGTFVYSDDACANTAVVVSLDLGDATYDYVEIGTGLNLWGSFDVDRIYPGPGAGTVSLTLDPGLDGRTMVVYARAYAGPTQVASGALSFVVTAGLVTWAPIDLTGCPGAVSACVDEETLRACQGDTTVTVRCVAGCLDGLCRPVEDRYEPGDGTCGAPCGSCNYYMVDC